MGYYTTYKLQIHNPEKMPANKNVIKEFVETTEFVEHYLDEEGNNLDTAKWYEHETDLKAFSKKYPEIIFKLSGEGEESGDIWSKYFQNGKMQDCRAKVVTPGFNPNKLL